jgi:hypothetical protein
MDCQIRRFRPAIWALYSALVACLALAGCGQATPGAGRVTATATRAAPPALPTNPPCDENAQWKPVAGNVALEDIAMDAPGDGWAVGEVTPVWGGSGPSAPVGVIYHLSGGRWTRLPQTYPGADLTSISMGSPTDGWAVSDSGVTGQGARTLVLHYTGGQWRQEDIPALDAILKGAPNESGGNIQWISVQMFGPDAGWLFAWSNIEPGSYPNLANVILRYEHGSWARIPLPPFKALTTLFWLSAVSGDEAWLAGTDYGASDQSTVFARYTNGAWRIWPQTFPGVTERMSMLSPTNGWAFDDQPLHFDGQSWAVAPVPADWASKNVTVYGAVYSPAPNVTWLVGSYGHAITPAPLLEQYANGQWSAVAWPFADALPTRIMTDGSGDLRGVGNIGHQEGCPPLMTTDIAQGVFFHQSAAGGWSQQILP